MALARCYFCGGPGELLLHRKLGDVSAMHDKVISMTPCSSCESFMRRGIILITIDEEKSPAGWNHPAPVRVKVGYNRYKEQPGIPDPFRTGGFFVITEDAFRRYFQGEGIVEFAMKHRFMFVAHKIATLLGLFDAHARAMEKNGVGITAEGPTSAEVPTPTDVPTSTDVPREKT